MMLNIFKLLYNHQNSNKRHNVILGGDLNFSMGFSKNWDPYAKAYLLSNVFKQKLEEECFIDIAPTKLKPTWSNKIIGINHISKRCDRLLLSQYLLDNK